MGSWQLAAANSEHAPLSEPGHAAAVAAHGAEAAHATEHHGLPLYAPKVGSWVTSSMLVTWIVALGVILFARYAMRQIKAVPDGAQNFWEWMVESLYELLESILGSHLVKKTFWFFATIFIFILFTNWFGLLPFFGTIGWGEQGAHGFEVTTPLLRGGNADLNMTLAMALIFFALWIVWSLQANGIKGFINHIFGAKGDLTGPIKYFMIVVFFLVGFLEVISIMFRPVSLTFRLFGNIFAGETMLEAMSRVVPGSPVVQFLGSAFVPIPFYFLEILVGFVQALVFMLLTSVFTMLMCTHDEEHEKGAH